MQKAQYTTYRPMTIFMYSVLYAKLITIGKGVKENAIAQDKRDKGVSVKIDACIICLLIT